MPSGHFWFCLTHHRVEESGSACGPADLLGPYPTREDAEQALDKVKERNEAWDNDPDWNDAGPGSGPVGR